MHPRHVAKAAWLLCRLLGGLGAVLLLSDVVADPDITTVLPLLLLITVAVMVMAAGDRIRQLRARGPAMDQLYLNLERVLAHRQHRSRLAAHHGPVRFIPKASRVSRVMLADTIESDREGEYLVVETFILLPIRPLVAWTVNGGRIPRSMSEGGLLQAAAAIGSWLPITRLPFMLATGAGMATEPELRLLLTQLRAANPLDFSQP